MVAESVYTKWSVVFTVQCIRRQHAWRHRKRDRWAAERGECSIAFSTNS